MSTIALGGVPGTLNLTTDGISSMPRANASFDPATLSTNASTVLTLTTSASTPAGQNAFTVIANSGNLTGTVTLTLRWRDRKPVLPWPARQCGPRKTCGYTPPLALTGPPANGRRSDTTYLGQTNDTLICYRAPAGFGLAR